MPPPPPGTRLLREVPLPPAPPGMKELPRDYRAELQADPAGSEAPDDPELSEEIEAESAELEGLRALEEAALDPAAQQGAELLLAIRRLGFGNPLRHRMHCAFDELDLRQDVPLELPPVTDLASFDVSLVKDQYDIPIEMQPLVAQYIRFFQGPGRKWYRHWMSRSTRYLPVMQPILESKGLPRDTVYLAMIESGFSSQAYSWAHAAGPWQFISSTGKMFGLKQDFWVDERRDPIKSTHAAAAYLTQLHANLGTWYLAWAGYNAGGGRLRRLVKRKGTTDFWQLSDGKGLARETKHYVPKLIAAALIAKYPRAFGFSDEEFDFQPPLEFDEVKLEHATDLEVVARAAGVDIDEVKELNPELKRWCTPPASSREPYALRVPKGMGEKTAAELSKLSAAERLFFRVHTVKRGDTVSAIAARYRSAPEAILRMNGLRSARALRVNAQLVVPVPSAAAQRAGRTDPALERQVSRARRAGIQVVRPEDEVPAGTQTKAVAQGPVKTEVVGGRTRVTYGVQAGDSLWLIAQRFDCSVEDLRRWNGLPRGRRSLRVGAVLTIWPGEKASVEARAGTVVAQSAEGKRMTHTIAAGETLWSVARRYGVSVEELRRWNGLAGKEIRAGQALVVFGR
ncbi:MAG: LysM peptidoglycan-binding domain-containing protein [Myxococcales bacterium]|nr:LysM peptidoglycan-binding domain-containing protein [Myxococcales bacterium]